MNTLTHLSSASGTSLLTADLALQDASVVRAIRTQQRQASPGTLARALAPFVRWFRVYEMREQLSRLDDRLLRDIGFDPEQARREAAKPFWSPCTRTPGARSV
jgi:uncharacterized protein YjiS (DUF1127 family)